MYKEVGSGPAERVVSIIQGYLAQSPENSLQNQRDEKAFENPLVGFSRADDPLYKAYKEYVGPFHWTPAEGFAFAFPELSLKPDELTVVSWVLPQTEATKADNRKESIYPSERWARARIFGEEVNVKLRKHVVAELEKEGYAALAPALLTQWERKDSPKFGLACTWSERHAAYASGLGTFGLCDGLITPRGKAVRLGSVVFKGQVPPTPRGYGGPYDYCLFFNEGICGKCVKRCPVGAVTREGHDKLKCREHVKTTTAAYVKAHYGFEGLGCGLCQTGVPCESRIPSRKDVEDG